MDQANRAEAERLRRLPIGTKDEAADFVAAYRRWVDAISTYGNGMALAREKPASVAYADVFRKASAAYEVAGLCFWQLPYDHKHNKAIGIPRETWARARAKKGLPV